MLNNDGCSLKTWNWWTTYSREEDTALKYLIAKAKTLGRLPTMEEAWKYEFGQIMGKILHHYHNYEEAASVVAGLLYANSRMRHPKDLSWMKNPPKGAARKALEDQYFEKYLQNLAEAEGAESPSKLLEERCTRRQARRTADVPVKVQVLPSSLRSVAKDSEQTEQMQNVTKDVERAREPESVMQQQAEPGKPETSASPERCSFAMMRQNASPKVLQALSALERLVRHYRKIPTQLQVDLYRKYNAAGGAMTCDSMVSALGPISDWGRMVDPNVLREVGIAIQ